MTLMDLKRLVMQDGNGSSLLRASSAAAKGDGAGGVGGGFGGYGGAMGMSNRGDWKKVRNVLGRLLF